MAYVSALQGGYGGGPSVIHTDATHADAVGISDAELLFTGHLERKGPDLVLTGHDGHRHIIPDYFSAEHPAALVAPNGAQIAGDLVELLAGSPAPGQYAQDAQAQAPAPTNAIGRIEKVVGDVTVMRNGVAVALHVGDAVYKNDVVQTGADSSAGIGFPDGTALNLVSNTRMALNDYVYDPNGTSNDALFNLVQGGFAFVAGKVAHTGDMKIGTPVATMGIRGTTGYALQQVATVSANVGNVTMSFAVVADPGSDRVGAYVLTDQFGNEVAVDRAGIWTTLSWNGGNTPPTVSRAAMTASNFAIEQALVPALVQIINNINNLNPNPQSGPNNPGSSTPPLFELINLQQYLQQNGNTQQSIINVQSGANTNTQTQLSVTYTIVLGASATSIVTWTSPVSGTWETGSNWSDLSTPAAPQYVNIAQPVKVTVEGSESADGLRIGAGAILNLTSGATLEVSQGIADFGTLQINSSGSDPTLAINGTVYLLNSGKLAMVGPTDENLIIGVAGTDAKLVNVNNTIIGSGTIGQGDGALTLINGKNGTIEATPLLASDSGLLIIDTGNRVSNSGTLTAAAGGTLQIDDPVTNLGLIQARADSAILFTGRLDNENTVQATGSGAEVTLSGGTHNQADAVIVALAGGLILLDERVNNTGSISASGAGSTVDLDKAVIVGGTVESSDGGVIATTAGQSTFLNVFVASGSTVDTDQSGSLDLRGTTTIDGTVTFEGRGTFELHHMAEIVGGSQPAELDNFGTIAGAGNIGGGDQHFVLVNEQSGVVDASGRLTLIIDNDSPGTASAPPSNAVINAGVIEATGSGGLTIENTTINNGAAAGTGHVNVFAGSQINLDNATLLQGIISIAAGGELAIVGSSEVGDATVLGGGQVTVDSGQTLTWDAVTLDNVTLSGNFNNTAVLTIEDTVTLNVATLSGGTIDDTGTLSVGTDSEITHTTVNGGGDITVATNQTLTFDTVTLDNVTLTGSFSNAGTTTTIIDAVTLNGATIAGGTVDLDSATSTVSSDSTIQLATLQDGTLAVAAGQTLTLNGLVLDNVILSGGTNDLDSAFSLVNANSTIENATLQNGTLTVAFGQTLTLDGATLGSVTLSGGTDDLDGASSVVTTESTIESTTLQDGMLTVVSGETLTLLGVTLDNVTLSGGTDDLDQKSPLLIGSDSTIQYATLQDDGTLPDGKLVVASGQMVTLDGVTLDNVILLGGTDNLDGATSTVSSDSTIEFATLQDGTLAVASGQTVTLDGMTLDNVILSGGTDDLDGDTSTVSTDSTIKHATLQDGTLAVASGQTLTLDGVTLDNVILSGGTDLRGSTALDGTVQFEGDGTFELHRQATIVTTSQAELDNTSTIAGSGTIGTGGMALVNDGAINADDHNGILILDPATLTNNDVLEATNGGILDVVSNVTGTGSAAISGGGTLELGGTDAQTVTLDDAGTLKLDGTSDFTGTLNGLAASDIIDLANTIVTTVVWNGSTLTVNGTPTAFHISGLPSGDTFAFAGDGGTGTDLTVEPQILTVAPTAETGIEGSPIGLGLGISLASPSDSLVSVTISDIPTGATLSDTNGATLTISGSSVTLDAAQIAAGDLAGLAITPANDTNFKLSVLATATDGSDLNYTVPATEFVTVDPAPPVLSGAISATVNEGALVTLSASDTGASSDDVLGNVTITGLPVDLTNFSGGGYTVSSGSGTWTGTAVQFNGLTFDAGEEGTYTLSISATTIGATGPTTESYKLTVADAPLTATGVNVSATEGIITGPVEVASFTDANPNAPLSDFTATINWGDGTTATAGTVVALAGGGFAVDGTHTYAEEGTDPISVTVNDVGGSTASATSTATVADAPLTATGVNVSATEGITTGPVEVASFTDANPNAPLSDFTATINWGDGTTATAGTVVALAGGGFAVDGTHTYAEEGTDPISVTVNDVGGSTASATSTATVVDAPLTATGVNVSATEGITTGPVEVASFTDANPNAPLSDFTATINWGDGTTATAGTVVALAGGGFAVDGTHTYAEEGTDPISVTVNDVGGSTASATSTATVVDAPLTATGVNVSATEGITTGPVEVASFTDANPNAPLSDFTATINWGDGTTATAGTVVALAGGGFAVDGTHTYAEEGTDPISVTVNDVGGSTASATSTATIAPAPPTIGFNFAPSTAALSALQDHGFHLASGDQIGTFTETGGSASDSYSFTIGGTDSDFNWGTNSGVLSTENTDLTGSSGGKVYALTVAVDDTTDTTNSGPLPFDVVIGSSGYNTINLETGLNNLGISAAIPTIVYPLNGTDTVNATGMTADVWFVSGVGSDTMTGGRGVNTFLYSSVSDSETPNEGRTPDTITNFNAATDIISFAAMAGITNIQGLLASTSTVEANSIAWIQGTGAEANDTIVYANIDSSSHHQDSHSGYELEIVLQGVSAESLTDTNASHPNFVLSNSPPAITVPGPQTIAVNAATTISGVSLSESGNTSGETFTVTLADAHGVLSATGGNWDSFEHTLTISGTLSQVTADLGTLQDKDSKTGSDTITVNATDGFGDNATQETIAVMASSTADDWSNASGGIWNSTGDWTNSIPGTATNAYIQLDHTYTVTINDNPSIHSLTISDPNATVTDDGNTVTLTNGLTIDAGATFDGSGTVSGVVDNNGTIDASVSGSTLHITGNISESGSSRYRERSDARARRHVHQYGDLRGRKRHLANRQFRYVDAILR